MVILACILLGGFIVFVVARPMLHSPDDRIKVLMCGRSTMGLWFKHWNWPYPLRIKTTYKKWPIAYEKYSRGRLYLEYHPLPGPRQKDLDQTFGKAMLVSLQEGLDKGKFDVVFFKFCFVDFKTNEADRDARYHDLIGTIQKVHEITSGGKIKLIVGNALPLLNPDEPTIGLQREYNAWLNQFAASNKDVLIFDFHDLLTGSDGRLIPEMARSSDDTHLGDSAFSMLDKRFFMSVQDWLIK